MFIIIPAAFLLMGIFLVVNPWRLAEEFVKSNIRLGGKVRASVDDRVLARFLGRPFAWFGLCGLFGYLLYDAGVNQRTLGVTMFVGVVAMAFILVYGFVDLSKSRKRVQ